VYQRRPRYHTHLCPTVLQCGASSLEAVADINMPDGDDNALMINDAAMVFARWGDPNFWPGCRLGANDDAITLNNSPILKDSNIAFMHEV
jgi:hypothetical protein